MNSRKLFLYIKYFPQIAVFWGVFSVIAYANNSVFAQITPDSTLGVTEKSEMPINVDVQGFPGQLINGGAIRGNNLFHSFSEFNVNNNERVYFSNPGNIENIISRVTGNQVSNILGTLGIDGNGSLFLINPNGILFGDNAQLDIEGSFLASTAKSLVFENGFEFSTDNPAQPPLLTINMPIGLQLGVNSGQIMLSNESGSSSQLNSSQTIGLIANGIVSKGGKIQAGQIEIGSVIDGEIGIIPESIGFKINYDNVQEFANISINNASDFQVGDLGGTLEEIGNLTISGADITVSEQSNVTLLRGNKVIVNGRNITFSGNSDIFVGLGDALAINGNYISFTNNSDAFLGGSGEITINGKQVNVSNNSYIWSVESEDLTINASNLYINGGVIYKESGQGSLNIYADESVEISSVSSPPFLGAIVVRVNPRDEEQKLATNLIIETKDLILRDGGQIISITQNSERGSSLSIKATNSIEVGGNIQLEDTFLPSRIFAGSGRVIVGGTNTLLGEIQSQGSGGNLSINTGKLTVFDQGVVTVSSTTLGDAGTLTITADSVFLDNHGEITATSDNAQGGNINLTVSDLLLMRRNSLISAQSLGTESQDGNITIDTDLVVTLPIGNSDIIARSTNQGNIEITAESIIGFQFDGLTELSDITASGDLTLNIPNVDPSQGLVELSGELTDSSGQIDKSCATTTSQNEFIITGRGGLPQSPNEIISPDRIQDDLGVLILPEEDKTRREQVMPLTPQSSNINHPKQIVEAQGWIIDEQGNVVLTAYVPNGKPQGDWQEPVNCQVPLTTPR
ncbi:MAG: filamentous hemagglutinin N-terminal domain-containing protein [Coleofasciculus sp. G1-WW12-02]|uniref:filamentous hemagglutinin N-terminal domain-containing protein n=1 Tax=Coleofasciculus sp. G1-WW12-02 TaxID=3068483 RepID=UPI0032F37E9F